MALNLGLSDVSSSRSPVLRVCTRETVYATSHVTAAVSPLQPVSSGTEAVAVASEGAANLPQVQFPHRRAARGVSWGTRRSPCRYLSLLRLSLLAARVPDRACGRYLPRTTSRPHLLVCVPVVPDTDRRAHGPQHVPSSAWARVGLCSVPFPELLSLCPACRVPSSAEGSAAGPTRVRPGGPVSLSSSGQRRLARGGGREGPVTPTPRHEPGFRQNGRGDTRAGAGVRAGEP